MSCIKDTLAIILALGCFFEGMSQPPVREPEGGGEYRFSHADEITPEQRASIIRMLDENKRTLQKQGKWAAPVQQVMAFQWPIAKKAGFTDNGYYGISNYVDLNPAYPNQITDYNCGTRSYDVSNGYNHRGSDIFSWPFSWYKMEHNLVEIVAAAGGTIIGKLDGNADKNCAFCTSYCDWNAVYVRHADGSIAFYGHMKSGSLTTKAVGATISAGEYLGVMGSSGNSTGPHLHFEVWTDDTFTKLVEPWAGPCNTLNGNTSWWASQQPYRVSTLNALMTHGAAPVFTDCSSGEKVNEKKNFTNGQLVFFGSYYRDQLAGQTAVHTIRYPNGTVYQTWNQSFNSTFSASWWYYSYYLPNPAQSGIWKYEITYQGVTSSTSFAVNANLVYSFSGNGSLFNAANWVNGAMPPNPVPSGVEVSIGTTGNNECVVDNKLVLLPGSKLTIQPNSKVRFPQNIISQ